MTAVQHDLRGEVGARVQQRGPSDRSVVGSLVHRWWDGLPEADKAILTGAAILSVPVLLVLTYFFVSVLRVA